MGMLRPTKYFNDEFNVLGIGARIIKIIQEQHVLSLESLSNQLLGSFSSNDKCCQMNKNKIEEVGARAIEFLVMLGVIKHKDSGDIEYIANQKKLNDVAINKKLSDIKNALDDGRNYLDAIVLEAKEDEAFNELTTVDSNICYWGWEKYYTEQKISDEEKSLEGKLEFDLEETKKIYEQANVYFNGQIESDYKKWIEYEEFRMKDFKNIFRENIARRKLELEGIKKELNRYKSRRKELISFLEEHEIFKKIRFVQEELLQMAYMQGKLEAHLDKGECVS